MTLAQPHPGRPSAAPGHEANMADVARRAGVSVATVSRALRDVAGVSEATRARVRAVAAELAYVVSPAASSLSSRATRRVAVVVPRIDVWYYASMLGVLERELRAAGLDVLLYQVDGQAQRSRFVEQLPARRKVDAVVLVSLPLTPEEVERLASMMGAPVVIAGGRLGRHPAVFADDHAIAALAVGHLADHGHRRVAMIRTDDTDGTVWSPDLERTRGYHDTVSALGLDDDPTLLATVNYSPDAGAVAMHRLLDRDDPPTAVFAYSDEIAVGALSAMYARGVRVPEDVSIIGVDGHPTAALFGLDTVDQDVAGQAREAGAVVAGLLPPAGEHRERPGVVVPHRLVVRGSTAAPRTGPIAGVSG